MQKSRRNLLIAVAVLCVSCSSSPRSVPSDGAAPSNQTPSPQTVLEAPRKSAARERAQDLITGSERSSDSPSATEAAATPTTQDEGEGQDARAGSPVGRVSVEDKQFLESYLAHLKYMMVMKEGVPLNEFQQRMVLTKGNEYLLKQGFDVVHYDQLRKNMDDQRAAYEAEVGEAMSLTQFIAQKLGADVYVELDSVPRAWSDAGRHYGEANFTANMFDPSTAELLGSVTFRTDRSLSTSSEEDALLNALVAGTAQFMPRVVRDSTAVLRRRGANGIRYQLIVQNTPDSRTVSIFRRNLRSRVREIIMGPSAADQTTMDVYLFGAIGVLEDACYAAFDKTPGLENAYWVYTRGKTITFNSGN